LFAGLYFAEGGPIGFIWWALPAWMRSAGAEPGDIARLMALVTWPWALKFLWAPMVDLMRTRRFGLRAWILTSQLLAGISLFPLFYVDFGDPSALLAVVLTMHAIAAATQDAAIDTLAVRAVPAAQRGAINGWMQTGMLVGRAIFGGGAVLLASHVGQPGVLMLLMAAVLLPGLLTFWLVPEPTPDPRPRRARMAEYRLALLGIAQRRDLWIGLLLASTAGAGFEGLATIAGPLMIDHGADEGHVGSFFLVAAVLMAAGALIGGKASDRYGRRAVTAVAEACAALSVIAVGVSVLAEPAGGGARGLAILLGVVFSCAGAAIAALYGLLMERTERTVAAFQFCAFMAGINLCAVWSTQLLGTLIDHYGYGRAVICGGALSIAVLPLIACLRPAPSVAH
jgi:MFS family permease